MNRLYPALGLVVLIVVSGCDRGQSPRPSTAEENGAVTFFDDERASPSTSKEGAPYERRRRDMVEFQLARRDITDERVLEVMRRVPRHQFVPAGARSQAYADHPLSIGLGQTISQPYIVAFMTQALGLQPDDRVLEIGTGSGYQAAVLAELCEEVYSIEIVPELSKRAAIVLEHLGYENIHLKIGDGYRGWPSKAPFDAIMVTAAPGHVPQPLLDQLAPGGRMILPVGRFHQDLILIEHRERQFFRRKVLPVRFVPMTGEAENIR